MSRFSQFEYLKFNRIYEDCLSLLDKDTDVSLDRLRFYQFIKEYDSRRGKNFIQTFPEYKNFLEMCRGKDV